MDPLSATASIASILTLAAQLVMLSDELHTSVKKRHSVLKAISNDLKHLENVLSQLKSALARKTFEESKDLVPVLEGCREILREVSGELNFVRDSFQGGIWKKTFAQLTFSNRIGSIEKLRGELESVKGTLIIALGVKTFDKISDHSFHEMRAEVCKSVSKMVGNEGTPARLEPVQQYLDTSFLDIPTFVDLKTARDERGVTLASNSLDKHNVASHDSFQGWLDSFLLPGNGSEHVVEEQSSQLPEVKEASDGKLRFEVHGLTKTTGSGEVSAVESIELEPSDFLYKAIQILHDRGYGKVCGFRQLDKFIGPLIPRDGKFPVTVTSSASSYSFVTGLRINQDESLEQFYDNLIRAGENGRRIAPLLITRKTSTNRISVVDSWESGLLNLEISLDRTLRVPEDGTAYHVPGLFGPFPLFDAGMIKPGSLSKATPRDDGLIIPMFQREALALTFHSTNEDQYHQRADFAIKVLSGSVNAISGQTSNKDLKDMVSQDHIIAPRQTRLDGFFTGLGVVKQFVAMPIGTNYTTESQITDDEFLGGIQLVIAPAFKGRAQFLGYEFQDKTPRMLGLSQGDSVFVEERGFSGELRRREYDFDFRLPTDEFSILRYQNLFQQAEGNTRPAFAHELLDLEKSKLLNRLQPTSPMVYAVTSLPLRIEIRPIAEFVALWSSDRVPWIGTKQPGTYFMEEISPFATVHHLYKAVANQCGVDQVVLFNGSEKICNTLKKHVLLHEVLGNGRLLSCECYDSTPSYGSHVVGGAVNCTTFSTKSGSSQMITKRPRITQGWDMGLAVGGRLCQDVCLDDSPKRWNWGKSRVITIQILNNAVFADATGVSVPPCPISFQDYVKFRLPFYHTVSTGSLSGTSRLETIKTVGDLDGEREIKAHVNMQPGLLPNSCTLCSKNLVDSILRPCNHVFCWAYVKASMAPTASTSYCAACQGNVTQVVRFSAPMEIPLEAQKTAQKSTEDTYPPNQKQSKAEHCPNNLSPDPTLKDAILAGRRDIVSSILRSRKDSCEPMIHDSSSALEIAAEYGDIEILKVLFSSGPNSNAPQAPIHRRTSIQAAADAGHVGIVEHLPEIGGNISTPANLLGPAALFLAAKNGHHLVVDILLKNGFSPNEHQADQSRRPFRLLGFRGNAPLGNTLPVHLAARMGHLSVLVILNKYGANLDVPGDDEWCSPPGEGYHPIHEACSMGHNSIVLFFLENRVSIEVKTLLYGLTPLMVAARKGHTSTVHLLIENGASLKPILDTWPSFVEYPRTALLQACKHGHRDVVEALLAQGIDPNEQLSDHDRAPLMEAAASGFPDIVRLLLNKGAKIKQANSKSKTSLHYAAEFGREEIFNILLENGADLYAAYKEPLEGNRTVLHSAAYSGNCNIGKLLLDQGVDLETVHFTSYSPLQIAARGKHWPFLDMILSRKSSHDSTDINSVFSSILNSFEDKQDEKSASERIMCIQTLINCGAELSNLKRSLSIAVMSGEPRLVSILLKYSHSNNTPPELATLVEEAAEWGTAEIINLLVTEGETIFRGSISDSCFQSALEKAARRDRFENVDFLMNRLAPGEVQGSATATIKSLEKLAEHEHMIAYLTRRYGAKFIVAERRLRPDCEDGDRAKRSRYYL